MNLNTRKCTFRLASIVGAALMLSAVPLHAQDPIERAVQMHSGPDEYYFFEDDRKQVVDYKKERMVRICAGESRHLVPLKVSYDGKSTTLGSNDCIRVEAKEVYLEPRDELDSNWTIRAEVETF